MNNMDIYNTARQCPQDALKPIQAGRLKGKSDINPMWRIKMLTELFGACGIGWYYEINSQWLEACGDEIAAFCNISLYIKINGEWSKPIQGVGGSMFAAREKSGIYVSDEAYKMALTDAISVACKALGFAADVYWNNDRTKYQAQAAPAQPKQKTAPVAQADPDQSTAPVQENQKGDDDPVSQEQAGHILHECERRGIDPAKVMQIYKHDAPEQFNQRQFKHLMANWGKVLDIIGGKTA